MTNVSVAALMDRYPAVFCDLWGVYHNGIALFPAAVNLLRKYREKGGVVILLTNAPRPATDVARFLDNLGAPPDSYDAIVTSGDATRYALQKGDYGRLMHLVGPERDRSVIEGINAETVPLMDAEYIFCTGLYDDETETADDYTGLIREGVRRGLPFLCANPDIVVHRGDKLIYCAGAIAEAYRKAGGQAVYFGKPHTAIYDLACEILNGIAGENLPRTAILAIGDGPHTDILGAQNAGIDALFVAGGILRDKIMQEEAIDTGKLSAYLQEEGLSPIATVSQLE